MALRANEEAFHKPGVDLLLWWNSSKLLFKWSPTGKARGTSVTYPPTPISAETLLRKCQGFGGVSASSGIRRSINLGAQE
jgi:hypothetical protein